MTQFPSIVPVKAAASTPLAVPPRPVRDTRVDIVRGWLQLTIFASHAAGSFIGAWLIHGAWGLSDSSEQFVFLSGLMLGSVFARKSIIQGWRAASLDMLVRSARLYRTQLTVFILFGLMAFLIGNMLFQGEAERLGWGFLVRHPVQGVIGGLTTFYQPAYMDILPVFIWCMLALPAFAWLEAKVGDWAMAVPVGLYVVSWLFNIMPPNLAPETGGGFNPLTWQILFLTGAWLGRRVLLNGQCLPPFRWLTAVAIVIVASGLWLRLMWYGFVPGGMIIPESDLIIGKDALAPPRLLHALALAWLVAVAVPRQAAWMRLALFRWLAAAGRFSLQVFCLGLFLSWGVTAAFRLWPAAAGWLDPLLMLAGCAILLLYGLWLDRRKDGQGNGQKDRQPDTNRKQILAGSVMENAAAAARRVA